MKPITLFPTLTLALAFGGAWGIPNAAAVELLNEDFAANDGGFIETSEGNSPIPFVYNAADGTWSVEGDNSGPSSNTLTSPSITMPTTGGVAVSFQHRYSIEAEWDGTAIQVSIEGGSFVTVPNENFTANGYTFIGLIGNHVLGGGDGFNGDSPGYTNGDFITSTAIVDGIPGGATFEIRFLGAWDEGARGPGLPNWEIDGVTVDTLEDTDDDGMPDYYEDDNGLDKMVNDAAGDLDSDTVSNLDEFLQGTDPQDDDTDGDGLLDGVETGSGNFVNADDTGTDPLNEDSDGDMLLDGVESNSGTFVNADNPGTDPNKEDTDGDGFTDSREIQAGSDPTNPASIPSGAVIAAYSFDDGTATDNSGNGFDGTVVGAVPGEGMFGDALVFDGSDSNYVITPDLGEHDEVTVACWFKVTGRVGAWRVIYNVDGWSAGWLHHQLYPDNRLGFSINSNPGGNDRHSASVFDATAIDTWRHVATVYSSVDSTLKFYVDGELDMEHDWGGNPVLLGGARIGAWSGAGRGFQGPIDEVIFLDYAASAGQVVDLMNSGIGETQIFQVTDIALTTGKGGKGNEVVFNFTSRAGKMYAVDRTTDLGAGWIELTDGLLGADESTEYRDTILPEPLPGKLFYRVREQ